MFLSLLKNLNTKIGRDFQCVSFKLLTAARHTKLYRPQAKERSRARHRCSNPCALSADHHSPCDEPRRRYNRYPDITQAPWELKTKRSYVLAPFCHLFAPVASFATLFEELPVVWLLPDGARLTEIAYKLLPIKISDHWKEQCGDKARVIPTNIQCLVEMM